jgi:hypothetical protein
MAEIVIRRRHADPSRTAADVVIRAGEKGHTERSLKVILYGMQRERGRGPWSDADPEVLVDGAVAGRLRMQESADELIARVLEWVYRDQEGGSH